eukprot:6488464-Amphidinium_carterae.1
MASMLWCATTGGQRAVWPTFEHIYPRSSRCVPSRTVGMGRVGLGCSSVGVPACQSRTRQHEANSFSLQRDMEQYKDVVIHVNPYN